MQPQILYVGAMVNVREAEAPAKGKKGAPATVIAPAIVTDIAPNTAKINLTVFPSMGVPYTLEAVPQGDAHTPGTWFWPPTPIPA